MVLQTLMSFKKFEVGILSQSTLLAGQHFSALLCMYGTYDHIVSI